VKGLARILRSSLFFSIILALFGTSVARADVDIIYFRGAYLNDVVVLEWETDFETNLNGFFVTRSDTQNGTYTRISELIPGEGDEGFGSTYEFIDEFILNDTLYWYRLEAVDTDNRVTYSELVQVITGTAHTPTATGATTALAITPSGSPPAQTTPARTTTPTVPLLPGAATATFAGPLLRTPTGAVTLTPMATAPLEATATFSPTTTLIPLPEITLQFPTPVARLDISSEGSEVKEDPSEQQRRNILSALTRAIFIGFIGLIWLVLAVWFYVSSRRAE
jgi:hypothetical protein